ncbi:Beta-lactamase OXA-1 precursor [Rickettsiales bacterium Ac37b]|nr:Beta-lactamase OXA-1 precursor [Rickettsiales bacterium Ac37b]
MNMFKIVFILGCLAFVNIAHAVVDYNQIFMDMDPCVVIYDLNQNKIVENFNSTECTKRISPCSTFKVPLSLMGYDSGILKDADHPEWKFNPEYNARLDIWRKDHNPRSWMANSVVWYSQLLTKKLGAKKFQDYVEKFAYGNEDVSGNDGKNDGLTESWLSSSLKISAYEQVEFLKKLINGKLPVSKQAMQSTKEIMFIEELENGWKLYGKTGSGRDKISNMQYGWFIGWVEKDKQTYVIALNIYDRKQMDEVAGKRAKVIAKEILVDFLKR